MRWPVVTWCVVVAGLAGWPGAGRGQAVTPGEGVAAFDALFGGPHAGARAVHAKGVMLRGRFEADPRAAAVSRAAHLAGGPVPVIVRFSNFPGDPRLADGDAAASPRGMAVRFLLPDGTDTDIVAHSYNGFPAATPAAFVAFLRAVPDPAALAALAAARPAVRAFLDDPKPAPASYATERYFGVSAFRFSNAAGVVRDGRYRLEPLAGVSHLSAGEAAALPPDGLMREIAARVGAGPVGFRLLLQLAGEGDVVTDGSVPWPEGRPVVALGTIVLDRVTAEADPVFQPTNLLDGIAPSADPMLLFRTQTYRISGARRGAAEE